MSCDPGVKALYLHMPFCARKCAYCDFASWATPAGDPLMGAYARALEAQLGEVASLGMLDGCETAYVGGGTPTLLGEKDLGRLVEKIVGVAAPSELTCEANPDSLTDGVLLAARERFPEAHLRVKDGGPVLAKHLGVGAVGLSWA